jgi:hypothetical protein
MDGSDFVFGMQSGADFGNAKLSADFGSGGAAVTGEHDGADVFGGEALQDDAAALADLVAEEDTTDELFANDPDLAESDGSIWNVFEPSRHRTGLNQFATADITHAVGGATAQSLASDGLKLIEFGGFEALGFSVMRDGSGDGVVGAGFEIDRDLQDLLFATGREAFDF